MIQPMNIKFQFKVLIYFSIPFSVLVCIFKEFIRCSYPEQLTVLHTSKHYYSLSRQQSNIQNLKNLEWGFKKVTELDKVFGKDVSFQYLLKDSNRT